MLKIVPGIGLAIHKFFSFQVKVTTRRKRLFSDHELSILQTKCADVIRSGPMTAERIEMCLDGDPITENYSFIQIRTRIDYERKRRAKKTF